MAPSSAYQPTASFPTAPPQTVAPPPMLHVAQPSTPLAPPPLPLEFALPTTSLLSTFTPVNYDRASTPYSTYPAQYHLFRTAITYPVQAASCPTS